VGRRPGQPLPARREHRRRAIRELQRSLGGHGADAAAHQHHLRPYRPARGAPARRLLPRDPRGFEEGAAGDPRRPPVRLLCPATLRPAEPHGEAPPDRPRFWPLRSRRAAPRPTCR
jgi:hypothetical protein